jgi:hypothetical protein
MKLTHEELLQVVKEELDAVIDEKKKKDCFKNKTFDGKVKCIQRTKGLSEKRASAYVASVLRDKGEIDEKKKKKAGTESGKESSLRDWFGRKGAKGKKKGWVDCNAPDGKGGYKSCGRGSGEKRKKYPACRPTPGACKERGKGNLGVKKQRKEERKNEIMKLTKIIKEELQQEIERSSPNQKFDFEDSIEELVKNYLGRDFSLTSPEQELISQFVSAISALRKTGVEQ